MLRRRLIFQVGDIHFPDHQDPSLDLKDTGVSAALSGALAATPLLSSMRALLKQVEAADHPVVVLNGDLTSRGDLVQYQACVDYLVRSINLHDRLSSGSLSLVVVPGNHDVDRTLAGGLPEEDLVGKFEPLEVAWHPHAAEVLATRGVLVSKSEVVGAALTVCGVNSCFGCATVWRDVQLQRDVNTLLDELKPDPSIAARIAKLGERTEVIDAPAFIEQHLVEVVDTVDGSTSCAVVAAHHNILQQAQPRVDLYTDLMNAGSARQRLAGMRRPLVYLHGHIHSDPIEVVTQHSPDYGELVCISAPEFCEGFNRIEVVYTESGVPLGCEVTRYRVRLSGFVSADNPSTRVRFISVGTVLSEDARNVYREMAARPDIASSDVLKREAPALVGVDECIEELTWFGLIDATPSKNSTRCNYKVVGM